METKLTLHARKRMKERLGVKSLKKAEILAEKAWISGTAIEQDRFLLEEHDGQGEIGGLIGGWLDITEKELLIAQLSETKSNLEQAIASKNAFMLSMGHEVRTPLNVITGLLELELQALDERQERNENLNLIWESSLSLLSLIGDMAITMGVRINAAPSLANNAATAAPSKTI